MNLVESGFGKTLSKLYEFNTILLNLEDNNTMYGLYILFFNQTEDGEYVIYVEYIHGNSMINNFELNEHQIRSFCKRVEKYNKWKNAIIYGERTRIGDIYRYPSLKHSESKRAGFIHHEYQTLFSEQFEIIDNMSISRKKIENRIKFNIKSENVNETEFARFLGHLRSNDTYLLSIDGNDVYVIQFTEDKDKNKLILVETLFGKCVAENILIIKERILLNFNMSSQCSKYSSWKGALTCFDGMRINDEGRYRFYLKNENTRDVYLGKPYYTYKTLYFLDEV